MAKGNNPSPGFAAPPSGGTWRVKLGNKQDKGSPASARPPAKMTSLFVPPPPGAAAEDGAESDSSGISDGDPPTYYSEPPRVVVPAPTAPSTSKPAPTPPTATGPAKSSKRTFEELEDIVFATPASFRVMALEIAEARGVNLLLSDDRTGKSASAYLHLCCAYRRAGCPMVLKLVRAREGGWIMRTMRPSEGDVRSRSNYKCRHAADAEPDTQESLTLALNEQRARNFSHVTAKRNSDAAAAAAAANGGELPADYTPPLPERVPKYPDRASNSPGKEKKEKAPAGSSKLRLSISSSTSTEPAPAPAPASPPKSASSASFADRALAPPFERSLNLETQLVPVLAPASTQSAKTTPASSEEPATVSTNGRVAPPKSAAFANPTHSTLAQKPNRSEQGRESAPRINNDVDEVMRDSDASQSPAVDARSTALVVRDEASTSTNARTKTHASSNAHMAEPLADGAHGWSAPTSSRQPLFSSFSSMPQLVPPSPAQLLQQEQPRYSSMPTMLPPESRALPPLPAPEPEDLPPLPPMQPMAQVPPAQSMQSMQGASMVPPPVQPPNPNDTLSGDGVVIPREFWEMQQLQMQTLLQESQQNAARAAVAAAHAAAPSSMPFAANAVPLSSLPTSKAEFEDWRSVLESLDPELTVLASALSSAKLLVTPASFFNEDESLQMQLVDSLENVAIWPKIKLKARLREKGVQIWQSLMKKQGAMSKTGPLLSSVPSAAARPVRTSASEAETPSMDATPASAVDPPVASTSTAKAKRTVEQLTDEDDRPTKKRKGVEVEAPSAIANEPVPAADSSKSFADDALAEPLMEDATAHFAPDDLERQVPLKDAAVPTTLSQKSDSPVTDPTATSSEPAPASIVDQPAPKSSDLPSESMAGPSAPAEPVVELAMTEGQRADNAAPSQPAPLEDSMIVDAAENTSSPQSPRAPTAPVIEIAIPAPAPLATVSDKSDSNKTVEQTSDQPTEHVATATEPASAAKDGAKDTMAASTESASTSASPSKVTSPQKSPSRPVSPGKRPVSPIKRPTVAKARQAGASTATPSRGTSSTSSSSSQSKPAQMLKPDTSSTSQSQPAPASKPEINKSPTPTAKSPAKQPTPARQTPLATQSRTGPAEGGTDKDKLPATGTSKASATSTPAVAVPPAPASGSSKKSNGASVYKPTSQTSSQPKAPVTPSATPQPQPQPIASSSKGTGFAFGPQDPTMKVRGSTGGPPSGSSSFKARYSTPLNGRY